MKNATRIQYALCRIRNHKNLKFKTTFSYDYTTVKGEKWYDPRTSNGEDENGEVVKRIREYKKMVWSNTLSYLTTFNNIHHLDFLAGYEIDDTYNDYLSGKLTILQLPTNMPLVME